MKLVTLCAAALVAFLPPGATAEEWRGLVVAPEERCALYDASEYHYPQSVEPRIADSLGGVYSPYTCETFGALSETDIEHIVAHRQSFIGCPWLVGAHASSSRAVRCAVVLV